MKKLLFLIASLITITCTAQVKSKKVFIGGAAGVGVPCVIWTPSNFDTSKVYPWVVALHGLGEIGDGSDAELTSKIVNNYNFSNLLTRAEKLGFVVIQPQLVLKLNDWTPGFKPSYINKAIDYAVANYKLDANKMYMTGLSMGGGACWEYVTSSAGNASKVAALIPICGTPTMGDYNLFAKYSVPVWAFHAVDDKTIAPIATQQRVQWVSAAGTYPSPIYTEYAQGGHNIWGKVYSTDDLYNWMLKQVNTGVVVPDPVPVPFKPTHKITRKDGSVEEVKIEATGL